MDFNVALQQIMALHAQYGNMLDLGFLVFGRVLGFIFTGPITNRKDIAFQVKLPLAIFLTVLLMWVIPLNGATPQNAIIAPNMGVFLFLLFINISIGMFLGFLCDLILKTVSSAGSFMNAQIGLSSAVTFDPSSRAQVMVLDRLFAFIGIIAFIHLGGFYWLILALERSFTMFPVLNTYHDVLNIIDLEYLVRVSGNVILIAVQLVSPVIIVTMSVDIILGIVNRTAQQMPVFQLSFALKPAIGAAIMLATLPIFMEALIQFLTDYAQLF